MTCVEAEKMVVPYMKDELSPTELEDFLDHIHTCENCREELEIHYMVDVGLKKLDVALGSDAFFPFGDNIERAHKSGVKYIAQPGGSVRDDNVIDVCNKYGMAMAFTGIRLFHH